MAFCPNCHAELQLNALECGHCRATFQANAAWKPLLDPPPLSPIRLVWKSRLGIFLSSMLVFTLLGTNAAVLVAALIKSPPEIVLPTALPWPLYLVGIPPAFVAGVVFGLASSSVSNHSAIWFSAQTSGMRCSLLAITGAIAGAVAICLVLLAIGRVHYLLTSLLVAAPAGAICGLVMVPLIRAITGLGMSRGTTPSNMAVLPDAARTVYTGASAEAAARRTPPR